jgi:hypothetical protein
MTKIDICRSKNPDLCTNHGIYAQQRKLSPKGARQQHGFANEDTLKAKYNLSAYSDKSYTAKFDAVAPDGIPVSIKTKGFGGNVELADYFRNAHMATDFYLLTTFWQGDKTNIVSEHVLKFPLEDWQKMFDSKWEMPIKTLIANSQPEHDYDSEWKKQCLELKTAYGTDSIIRLRPKRDSKGQARMQCAINYKDFLELEVKYDASEQFKQFQQESI